MAPNVGPIAGQLLSLGHISIARRLTHAVGTVNFRELHATHDESWNDLSGAFDNCILRRLHIKATHAAELLKLLHADKALD